MSDTTRKFIDCVSCGGDGMSEYGEGCLACGGRGNVEKTMSDTPLTNELMHHGYNTLEAQLDAMAFLSRSLESKLTAAQKALTVYGKHSPDCLGVFRFHPCNCGFDAAKDLDD